MGLKPSVFNTLELDMCLAPQRCTLFRQLDDIWTSKSVRNILTQNVLRATMLGTFSASQLSKVVLTWCVLYILTSKCASRHNGGHFFEISTSKSGLELKCFVHFDFQMCFAPQRLAIFATTQLPKRSDPGVFCTL